jgi:hypothetical protein
VTALRAERSVPSPSADGVLLVLGGEPWQQNGGGVFIEQLSRAVPGRVVHLSVALDGKAHPARSDWPWKHLSIAARGPVRGMGVLQRLTRRLASFVEWRFLRRQELAHGLKRHAAELRELGIGRVVYFLNSVEILALAPMLNELLGVPYSTMEWDLIDLAVDRLPSRRVRAGLSRAAESIRAGAATRGVASEGMGTMYENRWGLDSLVLRQTIEPAVRPIESPRDSFVVALCGTMIVPAEFRAFLDAMELIEWQVDGRDIEFLWIGRAAGHQGELPPQVKVTGWVSHARSLELLSHADLGYSGLWFDDARRPWVESSFPSKIISYLSAGVPVFYHGPAYGTPARFMSAFNVGFGCHDLEPAAIAATMQRIVRSPDALRAAKDESMRAVAAEFTPEVLSDRVRQLLRAPGVRRG